MADPLQYILDSTFPGLNDPVDTVQVVTGVILDEQGRALLIKRHKSSVEDFSERWAFPGGKVDPGEKPIDALTREFREEVTANIIPVALLASVVRDALGYPKPFRVTDYLCVLNNTPELTEEGGQAMAWMSLAELGALPQVGPTRQPGSIAGTLHAFLMAQHMRELLLSSWSRS